jgi:hypothetical protein
MARKKAEQHQCNCEKTVEIELPHHEKPSAPLDAILSNISTSQQSFSVSDDRINGIVVGKIVQIDNQTAPMVDFSANLSGAAVKALSTVAVGLHDNKRDVALAFVNGDPQMPVIIGFMHVPNDTQAVEKIETNKNGLGAVTVEKDGETVTISAEKQIVLKCGESSIILTRAGKVLLKGAYISSYSKGMNRIKGGAVQIN